MQARHLNISPSKSVHLPNSNQITYHFHERIVVAQKVLNGGNCEQAKRTLVHHNLCRHFVYEVALIS